MAMSGNEPFSIVPRQEWNARPTRSLVRLRPPVEYILVTWTNSDHCHDRRTCLLAMEAIQENHMTQGLEDIGFNFVIGGDGLVYEGRGWETVAMEIEDNKELLHNSILVAHVGKEGMIPTRENIEDVDNLISFGKIMGFLKEYTKLVPLVDLTQHELKLESKD